MESELDVTQQALAASREACRTEEEEASHLIDERVSLLVELGASKDEFSAFLVEVTKEKKALEAEYDAWKSSSIMDTAAVPLRTIFVEVSLGFQMGCRARHNHYHQSSSLILDPLECCSCWGCCCFKSGHQRRGRALFRR